MTLKISHIKSSLEKFGVRVSIDNLRKLEKAGIIFTTHNSISKHREFSEEQFNKSMKNLVLYYYNTPISDILKDSPAIIKERVKKIRQGLKLLT